MDKTFGLKYFKHPFAFPPKEAPRWGENWDRMGTLDAYAFGLIDAFSSDGLLFEDPDLILLASPSASNDADRQFVLSGAKRPAKMVQTLPNVRITPLLNFMKWAGPVLCVQKDPQTILTGLIEGLDLLDHEIRKILLLSAVNCRIFYKDYNSKGDSPFEAHLFSLTRDEGPQYSLRQKEGDVSLGNLEDETFLQWLDEVSPNEKFEINPGLSLCRHGK